MGGETLPACSGRPGIWVEVLQEAAGKEGRGGDAEYSRTAPAARARAAQQPARSQLAALPRHIAPEPLVSSVMCPSRGDVRTTAAPAQSGCGLSRPCCAVAVELRLQESIFPSCSCFSLCYLSSQASREWGQIQGQGQSGLARSQLCRGDLWGVFCPWFVASSHGTSWRESPGHWQPGGQGQRGPLEREDLRGKAV